MMWDIESADLGFRPLSDEDVTETLIGWLNDPEINRYIEARHEDQTEDTVAAYIAEAEEDPSVILMGAFDRVGGDMIGTAKLSGINGRYRIAELGIMVGDPDMHGQGFGTQMVAVMTEIGLVDLSLRKITATIYEPQVNALQCFEKNDFREEGFLREQFLVDDEPMGAFVLGRLRDDW